MKREKPAITGRGWLLVGFVGLFAVIGTILLLSSHAASPFAETESENGTLGGSATLQSDSTASGGKYVQFGSTSTGGGGGNSSMMIGLNAGGWGPDGNTDLATTFKYARIDQTGKKGATGAASDISDLAKLGVKVDVDFSGPYEIDTEVNNVPNTGVFIRQMDANAWAANSLTWYKNSCTPTECPFIEVLNEPSGDWFWGSGASDQDNATAYANLVKTTYIAFHDSTKGYGANAPKIIASYDNKTKWGGKWWSSSMSQYVDGVVVHPYGGTGAASQSKLGDHNLVTNAHNDTGKPVYITEVGWPTNIGTHTAPTSDQATGDSLQWPESNSASPAPNNLGDQCNNVYNFTEWARSTGYVNAVMIYGFRGYYGLEDHDSPYRKKAAWGGLQSVVLNQSNPCPNPLQYQPDGSVVVL